MLYVPLREEFTGTRKRELRLGGRWSGPAYDDRCVASPVADLVELFWRGSSPGGVMLTRIEVDGLKNPVDFELDFGPTPALRA